MSKLLSSSIYLRLCPVPGVAGRGGRGQRRGRGAAARRGLLRRQQRKLYGILILYWMHKYAYKYNNTYYVILL